MSSKLNFLFNFVLVVKGLPLGKSLTGGTFYSLSGALLKCWGLVKIRLKYTPYISTQTYKNFTYKKLK